MTEYILNKFHHPFSYRPSVDKITIGAFNFDMFTDDELTEFISGCLTHEHTHRALFKIFDNTVSTLFDGIEYIFRNDELHKKHIKGTTRWTYQAYIKKHGYAKFLEHYGLDYSDVLGANILCNTRKED